jgi:hypothetical protein
MLDLEPFNRGAVRNDAFEQGAKRGNVPLAVAEIVDEASLGLAAAGAKRLVERPVRGPDDQVLVEDDQGAGNGLDDVAGGNFGQG